MTFLYYEFLKPLYILPYNFPLFLTIKVYNLLLTSLINVKGGRRDISLLRNDQVLKAF